MTAADRLRRLAVAAPTLGPDGAWLAEVLVQYLVRAPAGLTLDAACGLALGPGGEPWWRTEARHRRDDLIRDMRRKFFPTKSTHGAAVAITDAARRYEATGWRRDRTLASPPPGYAGTIRETLWLVLATGERFPSGWRQITEILDGRKLQSIGQISLQIDCVTTQEGE